MGAAVVVVPNPPKVAPPEVVDAVPKAGLFTPAKLKAIIVWRENDVTS